MTEKNLFVYGEQSPVKHGASRFFVRKNVTKKKKGRKKEKKDKWYLDGLISQIKVLSVFYPGIACTTLCWLHIPLSTCWMSLAPRQFFLSIKFYISYYMVHIPPDSSEIFPNKQFKTIQAQNTFGLPFHLLRGNK